MTEKTRFEKDTSIIIPKDPLTDTTATSHRLTPVASEKSSEHTVQHSVSPDMPIEEIRHRNNVERWRNKLRLQEKFQVNYFKSFLNKIVSNSFCFFRSLRLNFEIYLCQVCID